MNINVGPDARGHFWGEPPAGSMEFWAFSFVPPCTVGEELIFRFDGVAVARAIVHRVEEPGRGACDASRKYGDKFKVFWTPESFEDLRGKAHGIPNTEKGPGHKLDKHGQGALFQHAGEPRGRML